MKIYLGRLEYEGNDVFSHKAFKTLDQARLWIAEMLRAASTSADFLEAGYPCEPNEVCCLVAGGHIGSVFELELL